MKQEDRRRQTTARILETTLTLIKQKGCEAVTLKDIVAHSGLSKGAIFHYVKSKEEIFAWILREQIEQTNTRFLNEVHEGGSSFAGPMERITEALQAMDDPRNLSSQVLMYLLGKEKDPKVTEVLNQFYDTLLNMAKSWIEIGQQHGVIQPSVDADTTAEMFVLLGFGMRMRASFSAQATHFNADRLARFIAQTLQS
ncbi:TetR/AcrR family transcriptional regulator [Marinicrinis sediminis]|uniref:TetR/AcrR family transcriptional regulator n=1 Tax=Marinicrinis sediminis TaxID=1652465 RepID=A0ABW5RFC8_9BACL